MLNSQLTN